MGKGSKRRPEDAAAIARNWPLKRTKVRDYIGPAVPNEPKCPFCYRQILPCERCDRLHCSCTPIGNCRDPRPLNRRRYAKGIDNPYGFEAHRTGFADGPAELDTGPNINQEFVDKRRRG